MLPSLHRGAIEDIRRATRWYERQRKGLGREFADEVNRTISQVVDDPELFPRIRGRYRRALVHRFPYAVFFRQEGLRIIVAGCLHQRRDAAKVLKERG